MLDIYLDRYELPQGLITLCSIFLTLLMFIIQMSIFIRKVRKKTRLDNFDMTCESDMNIEGLDLDYNSFMTRL
jgi:hypothetical protein